MSYRISAVLFSMVRHAVHTCSETVWLALTVSIQTLCDRFPYGKFGIDTLSSVGTLSKLVVYNSMVVIYSSVANRYFR